MFAENQVFIMATKDLPMAFFKKGFIQHILLDSSGQLKLTGKCFSQVFSFYNIYSVWGKPC